MKKHIIKFIVLSISFPVMASEYNFYFYGEDGLKKPDSQEKVQDKAKNEESVQGQSSQLSDDERIKKLAEEIASKIKPQTSESAGTPEVAIHNNPDVTEALPKSYLLADPKNYWGVGVASWSQNHAHQPMVFAQAKFLPILTAEAAMPLTSQDSGVFDNAVYVGGLAEVHLSESLLANLSAGYFLNKNVVTSTSHQWVGSSYKTSEVHENKDIPYVGVGLKWQLLKNIHISGSFHRSMERSLRLMNQPEEIIKNYSSFWTVGVSLNFS